MEDVARTGSIAFFAHPWRGCAYEEASAVREYALDSPGNVASVLARLEAAGFPGSSGLVETGLIIRRHSGERVVPAMEEWWNPIRDVSHRDQLSTA